MTNTIKNIGLVIAGVVVGLLISAGSNSLFGGVYNQVNSYFRQGIEVGTSSQFDVDSSGNVVTTGSVTSSGDSVFSGGTLNVTTSNTATSTVIGGCFQFYATSTATAHKFQASTSPGTMVSAYGTCPNL